MSETFGERLRRLRTEAGLSQPRLARLVFVTQSFVSKVENGAEPPSPEFAKACDEALDAAGTLTDLAPTRRKPRLAVEGVEAWELTDLLTSSSLSGSTLGQMRRAVMGYASTYPQATPEDLLVPVHQQLRRLRRALAQPQPIAVRREAVQLAGLLAGIAGNLALDLHRDDQAEGYFDVAHLAGQEAEDGDLIAWALATRSLVPFFGGQPGEALQLLNQARGIAARSSSARRRAWIAALHARASAATGDAGAALAHLDAAHADLAVAQDPEGNDFFDEARLKAFTGSTMLLLRRADEASIVLAESLAGRPVADAKGRALATLDLASCRVIEGAPDEALALIRDALRLARGSVVAPIVARVQDIQAAMMAVDRTAAERLAQTLRALVAEQDPQE